MSPKSLRESPPPERVERSLAESDALHRRVREFASRRESADHAEFCALAWDIALFQRSAVPGIARLWQHSGLDPNETALRRRPLSDLPQLPVDAMRFRDVFAFDVARAERCFQTSGTTASETGRHFFRTTRTYEALALDAGRAALWPEARRAVAIALMPDSPTSSLAFMCAAFMRAWDGAGLELSRSSHCFAETRKQRWLLAESGIDLDGLRRCVRLAHDTGEPMLLCATSFALVMLFDRLGDDSLPLPPGSVVMPTGGFKGRTREVDPRALRDEIERRLQPHAIVHEYGMTELSSQLYEATNPGVVSELREGVYLPSKTLRVLPVDPTSLQPVPDGNVGLASFIDLGNIDSAVRILTQDLVVKEHSGIRLLGRSARAPARGCSLSAEMAMLSASVSVPASTKPTPLPLNSAPQRNAETRAARARIERLLWAARQLVDPANESGIALRKELLRSTGLSREGVERALSRCLEVHPSDEELCALERSVEPARRVWIISSANVFVAAHRALALGLAASDDVRIRPSRRDPSLSEALHALVPDLFQIITHIEPEASDHVHAYGSSETMRRIVAKLPDGVGWFPHGDGIGIGFVAESERCADSARGFADDVVLFDQRGCLSPRIIVLGSDVDLDEWLDNFRARSIELFGEVPLGALSPEERADTTRFKSTAAVVAEALHASGPGWIAVQHEPEHVLLPPVGRNVVVVTGRGGLERLAPAEPLVTCVGVAGGDASVRFVRAMFPRARVCAPGAMQRPKFDGPVDRRRLQSGVKPYGF